MKMPKLRFKADDGSDFQEWEKISLGEIFTISAGGDLDKSKSADKQNESFPYPVYSNSLQNKGLFGYASYYKIDGNTFTVTGRGDVGHAIARHEKYVPIVRLLVCKPKFDDNVDFFAEQVNLAKFANESTGVPQLTAPKLKELKVSRPSIAEQYKIANLLLAVDAVIEKQQGEITAWEQYKKGVVQKLFDQEVRFKADDGSDFPNWQQVVFGDIMTCYSGGTPLVSNEKYYGGSIPFLKSGEIHCAQTHSYITELGLSESSAKMVKKGDLLYSLYRQGTCGDVALAKIDAAINQAILCIVPNNDNRSYLMHWLEYKRDAIRARHTTAPTDNLSAKVVKSFIISLPVLEEQRKIAECLDAIDDVIALSKAELEKWRELKKGLLQQLFV